MNKTIIVLRGPSGAGKSTYAQRVKKKLKNLFGISCTIASADDFFMKSGSYRYDRAKIGKAHEECQDTVRRAMNHNVQVIIVDNTNISRSDFASYIRLAQEFGYKTVEKIFGLDSNIDDMFIRGKHGVPREKIVLWHRKLTDSVRNVSGAVIRKSANGILTVEIER